jgi:hypothetical protein
MSHQEANTQPRLAGNVAPAFPLALLESVRSHDHPGEILEDEDITLSLPRRFGLTDVVITQILRYEAAQKARRQVRLDDVVSLVRLVMRRPDAQPILAETGQRLARWRFNRTPRWYLSLLRRAPQRLGSRAARRNTKKVLLELRLGSHVEVLKPYSVEVTDPVTATVDADGPACTLVTSLLTELIRLFTGVSQYVRHDTCVARGEKNCVWVVD